VIEKADESGVAIDTCHLSAAAAALEQVLAASQTPTIHSHGASTHPRSKTLGKGDLEDKQIRAITPRCNDSGSQVLRRRTCCS